MDELDLIFDEVHGNQPAAAARAGGIDLDAIFDAAHGNRSSSEKADRVAGQLGKGAALGWFDEFGAAETATRSVIADLFGRGQGKTWSEVYDAEAKKARQQDAQFEAENPGAALALQMSGALIPSVISGGTASAATGRGLFGSPGKRLMQDLFGAGITKSPSVLRLAEMGAVGGAVAGTGASDDNRLAGLATGAGIGAVAAPVVGKVVETGVNVIGDALANNNIWVGAGGREAQRGSFSLKDAQPPSPGGFTPEEIILAKQLKNTPIEKVVAGADELAQAVDEGVPLFLPEAVGSPKVDRNARFIANYEPSLEFSQTAIKERASNAPARATKLFDFISSEDSSFDGANKLVGAADEILTAAEKSREELVKPLYGAAYEQVPHIKAPELDELLSKDQVLSQAIKNVKKTANNADLADNSTQVLVKARHEIGNQIESAIAKGEGRKARDLTDTYNRLNKILHTENPLLDEADKAFAKASQELAGVNETFISNIRKMTGDKVQNIGQIFNLPADRIKALKGAFQEAGKLDEWNAGIRAHLQNLVDGTGDGRNFTDKITGNTVQRAKLQAALDEETFNKVSRGLNFEDRMFEGKQKYHAGSSTKGNLDESKEFQRNVGLIQKFKNSDWMGILTHMFQSDMPEETAQELARIYFDPSVGKERLERILPLLNRYAQVRIGSQAASKGSAISSREADDLLWAPQSSAKRDLATSAGIEGLDTTGIAGEKSYRIQQKEAASESTARSIPERSDKQLPRPGDQQSARQQDRSQLSQSEQEVQSSLDPRLNEASTQGNNRSSLMSAMFSPERDNRALFQDLFGGPKTGKVNDFKAVEAEIDKVPYYSALYEAESGRNPKAKNPESSASGGFQFIKSTAKSLGLDDPMHLGKSFDKVKQLTSEHVERFGQDPARLYAAHFLGAPLLEKVLEGKKLKADERAHVEELLDSALPRFMRIYRSKFDADVGVSRA